MYKDPVCGMGIDDDKFSFVYRSKKFNFCSQGCLEKFKKSPKAYSVKQKYDLIIIGAGPAGLTAGVYASILKINTLLLSTDIGGQAVDSTKIRNYMGFDFITGPELSSKFQNQLLHEHYIDHKVETVISICKQNNNFFIKTLSGQNYKSKALIVATGMVRNKLGVPGERKFSRKGVCYAAGQDIPLLAGKKVAVVGGGNSAL
jgi:alkyl hydroperoxide reductase subunit F